VVELRTDTADVLDVAGPRHDQVKVRNFFDAAACLPLFLFPPCRPGTPISRLASGLHLKQEGGMHARADVLPPRGPLRELSFRLEFHLS
jgi:hypothetical protein